MAPGPAGDDLNRTESRSLVVDSTSDDCRFSGVSKSPDGIERRPACPRTSSVELVGDLGRSTRRELPNARSSCVDLLPSLCSA